MRDRVWITLATIAALVPFLDKPIHIDDPVYVWVAQWIPLHPADFYGFAINWHGFPQPLHEITKNPPGASFLLALFGSTLGWSERALHTGFLCVAIAAALGVYELARPLCAHPVVATLATIWTPAFVVSASGLSSETPMFACWVWAIALWIRGLDRGRASAIAASGALCALAVVSKYAGASALPLLGAYTLARGPRSRWALPWLALPLLMVAAYEAFMWARYPAGSLLGAGSYALQYRGIATAPGRDAFIGIVFLGGAVATSLFLVPLLWTRRAWAAWGAIAVGTGAVLAVQGDLAQLTLRDADGIRGSVLAQVALFAVAGLQAFALAGRDLVRRRDAGELLCVLALGGTFVFAVFLNWTINVRSLLPAVPAVGILVARGLGPAAAERGRPGRGIALALGAALLLALIVGQADYALAKTTRSAAQELVDRYHARVFVGHWGLQYYLERAGAVPLDLDGGTLSPGDLLVVPENNSGVADFPWEDVETLHDLAYPVRGLASTMSVRSRAGFHASVGGPVPFLLGTPPAERYRVVTPRRPLRWAGGRPAAP